jgi:hypothetical protein
LQFSLQLDVFFGSFYYDYTLLLFIEHVFFLKLELVVLVQKLKL